MHAKIQKTKQALCAATLSMLETHSIREITVTELCKKANVNRTTFYKYYSVPSDVVEEYLDNVREQVLSYIQIPNVNSSYSLYEQLLKMCLTYYTEPIFSKLYTYYHYNNSSYIQKQLASSTYDFSYDKDFIYFISGGVDAVLIRWIENGFLESPEEIAKKLDILIHQMISLIT